jgi:hypothetical protein
MGTAAYQPWQRQNRSPMCATALSYSICGAYNSVRQLVESRITLKGYLMHSIIYIVGAVVIIVAILSFIGLR